MQWLIISYLLQKKQCALPGIGRLHINYVPAKIDTFNHQILPPYDEVIFENKASETDGLVNYISAKENISSVEAEKKLLNFCKEWKEKINAGDPLYFATLGSIQKNEKGSLVFIKEENSYLQPVPVNKTDEDIEEQIAQSGDIVAEYEEHEVVSKHSYWKISALVLLVLASAILIFHFYNTKFSASAVGNQNTISADSTGSTYFVPAK